MRTGTNERAGAPVAVAAGGLLLFVAVPVLFVVLQGIFPRIGSGSLAEPFGRLADTLRQPGIARMILNTALLGTAVAAIASLIAIPLGVVRALYRVPLAPLWDILLLVPFMIPPYIATLGWIMTLQPRGYLQQLTGIAFGPYLYSVPTMAFVMALNAFPIVYFAVSRTVEAVGSRYADVARLNGATPSRAFWRITLPLSTPGLAASVLLVFATAIEEYGTPAALGRQAGFDVLVTAIDTRVSDWPIDLPGAAVLSIVLVLLSLCAFLLQRWIVTRRSFVTTGGKPQQAERRPLGWMTVPVVAAFALAALLSAGVPLLAILATAMSRTLSGGLAIGNLGLQNFALIAENSAGGLRALATSLTLGVVSAAVAGGLGALAAYAVVKRRFRGRGALDALTVAPNATPGVVVAVGLILAWNQPWLPVTPYNTGLILLFAYCCLLLPLPMRYASAAFQQVGDNLEAAARVCGATPAVVFRRIMLPLALPSILAAMLLVFAIASRELVASILLAPPGMQTVGTFIWRQFEQGSVGLGMAMAFIAIVITSLLPMVVLLAMRRSPAG